MKMPATVKQNSQDWAFPPQLSVDNMSCDVHLHCMIRLWGPGVIVAIQVQAEELDRKALPSFKRPILNPNTPRMG